MTSDATLSRTPPPRDFGRLTATLGSVIALAKRALRQTRCAGEPTRRSRALVSVGGRAAVLAEDGEHARAEQVDAADKRAHGVSVNDAVDDAGIAGAGHAQARADERDHGGVEAGDMQLVGARFKR